MYTVTAVLGKVNREWSTVNFETVTVVSLLSQYDQIIVEVTEGDSILSHQYNLKTFKEIDLVRPWVTLKYFFNNYTGVLPTALAEPKNINYPKHMLYSNLWNFGLKAERMQIGNTALSNNPHHQPDIQIIKPEAYPNALSTLINKVLFLVNGFIYFETVMDDKVYLTNAAYALDRYDSEYLGVIDFSALGGFTRILLTETNVTVFNDTLSESVVHVSLPTSMYGQTPLLVLNGKLRVLTNDQTVIDSQTVAIKVNKKALLTDLVDMEANQVPWVDAASWTGDGFILDTVDVVKAITSGNSAVLLIDTDELCIRKTPLIPTGFQGRYIAAAPPKGLLIHQDGSIGDYSVTGHAENGYEISSDQPKLLNGLKDTIPDTSGLGINNANLTFKSETSMAQLLDLYIL